MKYEIMFMSIVGIIVTVSFLFVPFAIFFIALVGGIISAIMIFIARTMSRRMFPTRIRVWEKRANGFTVTIDTRAKRIKHKGLDKYELMSGGMIKAPSKFMIIRGDRDNYLDIYTPDGYNLFPIDFKDMTIGKLSIMDENAREWLAHEIVRNKEITKPPATRLQEFMPILVIATTGIVLMVMIVAFMQYFPQFVSDMTNVMTGQINAMNAIVDKLQATAGITASNTTVPSIPGWATG